MNGKNQIYIFWMRVMVKLIVNKLISLLAIGNRISCLRKINRCSKLIINIFLITNTTKNVLRCSIKATDTCDD